MNGDEWNDILRRVKEDDESGPFTCLECDEFAVSVGQRFENGEVVEHSVMCFHCEAEASAPA